MPTTSQRGYGNEHQKARARLLAQFIEGTPCRKCGRPMWSWQKLDAGHNDRAPARTRQPPDALEHAHCNRVAGARIAGLIHAAKVRGQPRTSRHW